MKIKIDKAVSSGVREIILSGSTVKAYLIKRDERPIQESSTVYVLMDKDRRGFYIGQTGEGDGSFAKRFVSHSNARTEKWWSLALCIVDTTGRLDNENVRKWIESSLYEIAAEKKYVVVSSATKFSAPVLDSEKILSDILEICWLFGIPWAGCEPAMPEASIKIIKTTSVKKCQEKASDTLVQTFKCTRGGSDAVGCLVPDGFKVLKGSRVVLDVSDNFKKNNSGYYKMRIALEVNGTIKRGIFTRDHVFSAPSAASAVIVGRASNGKLDWRTQGGKPLADYLHR